MNQLPQGWVKSLLIDLLEPLADGRNLHQGWSPQCEKEPSPNNETWGVLKTTAIQNGSFLPEHNKRLPLSLDPRPHLEVCTGDILLTCAGPRNRCGVPCLVRSTRPKLMISGKMYRMRASKGNIDSRFIEAVLRASNTQEVIDDMKTGINDSGMNLTHERFSRLEILLPPFTEQRRIADKLDDLFKRSRNIRDTLDRLPRLLDKLRKSILLSAFRGDLTKAWREQYNYPVWETVALGELIEGKPKNGYSAKPVGRETPWRVLTLTATTMGRFRSDCYKYFDEPIPANSHFWLKHGDILVQRGNTIEYVGVPAIYDGPDNEYIYPDLMMCLRPGERVKTEFLWLMLSAESSRQFMRSRATGTAGNMPKINQQTLMSVPIPVPSELEQVEIVRQVLPALDYIDSLRARVGELLNRIERNNQSLLAKAFRGELVPQDSNDEPASVLLERIKAERANAAPKQRGRVRQKPAT